jgi:hypothetical protein
MGFRRIAFLTVFLLISSSSGHFIGVFNDFTKVKTAVL